MLDPGGNRFNSDCMSSQKRNGFGIDLNERYVRIAQMNEKEIELQSEKISIHYPAKFYAPMRSLSKFHLPPI